MIAVLEISRFLIIKLCTGFMVILAEEATLDTFRGTERAEFDDLYLPELWGVSKLELSGCHDSLLTLVLILSLPFFHSSLRSFSTVIFGGFLITEFDLYCLVPPMVDFRVFESSIIFGILRALPIFKDSFDDANDCFSFLCTIDVFLLIPVIWDLWINFFFIGLFFFGVSLLNWILLDWSVGLYSWAEFLSLFGGSDKEIESLIFSIFLKTGLLLCFLTLFKTGCVSSFHCFGSLK